MRVIAGKYRSRRLKGPGTMRLRPTSDRLRETLFNVLGPSIADSYFVDLFAGTGAVGIEAISRGARDVFFVESSAKAARLIRDNVASLEIRSGAEVIEADADARPGKAGDAPPDRRFYFSRSAVRKSRRLFNGPGIPGRFPLDRPARHRHCRAFQQNGVAGAFDSSGMHPGNRAR